MKYVNVAVLTYTRENFDTFTYAVPADIPVEAGQVIKVPFRKRSLYALIIDFCEKPIFDTREISESLDIVLPKHMISLAKWMSEYYLASMNAVLRTILPGGFYKKRQGEKLAGAEKNSADRRPQTANITLTPDQRSVVNQINKNSSDKPYLLFGVTGSGKTEIYMRVIEEELKKGKGSIVLVPEIALTPQTIQRFEERFPGEVTVFHSHLKETERQKNWNDIRDGGKRIVVGSRSAIFAPFPRLGAIIVDEEHETSYKQEQTPRYHAVKIAEKLAKETGAKLILGSATPSVESFYKAKNGDYTLLNLPKRISGDEMPEVSIVDLKKEFKGGNKSIFSIRLQEEMERTLKNGKKILLFLNRRGASTYIFCRDCGYVEKCPHCEIPLTYHSISLGKGHSAAGSKLVCHHCDFRKIPPTVCPECKSTAIKYLGVGTQKVEDEIRSLFPKVKVIRMDKDTTAKRGSHNEIYDNFAGKGFDVLVGTQMIAKGWDLPDVDLVGVILADVGINFPDFRSAERSFQILTQVAGRPGRAENKGRVIIQTYDPENFAILKAKKHDYLGFYREEIVHREKLSYPPFKSLIRLGYENSDLEKAEAECLDLSTKLNKKFIQNIGPSPSFIPKLRGMYRWNLLIKYDGKDPKSIVELVPKDWVIDIDPTVTT